jgi:DNA-binding NtrC family response regulator
VLAEHFLERINRASPIQRTLSEDAMRMMMAYDWPGNVRELENCLERAGALTTGPVIHTADLPSQLQTGNRNGFHPGSGAATSFSSNGVVPMAEIEKQAILSALQQLNGDKLMTARMLGIGKTTLYRKLKEYGVQ